jgi:RNA polymerase sigma factor (sigma-70 family)
VTPRLDTSSRAAGARAPSETGSTVGLPSEPERAHELATRAAAGDLAATQEFLGYVWPTLCRVTSGVLGAQHPDLDDAVQQSMIALLRALPAFRGECHPAGYASRITLRVALRVRRGHKRDLTRREQLSRLNESDEKARFPNEDALAGRRRELLRELLQDLPEEQAEALALRVVMGWTLEEVSLATGAPINTVRSRVRLAKEALRRRIESVPELGELKGQP